MLKNFTITKVSHSNFQELLTLIEQLAFYEQVNPPDEQGRQRLRKDCLGDKPLFEAYLASREQQPIGYLIVYYIYSSFLALPVLFIEDVFVIEEYRRQGYGQQLFDFCKQLAKQKGCGRMEWNVYTWNTPALRFYEKNHAKKLDKYYYRLDRNQFA